MKKNVLIALMFLATAGTVSAQKNFTLSSPDGNLQVQVSADDAVRYSVIHKGDVMITPSPVSMQLDGAKSFGIDPKLSGSSTRRVDNVFDAPIYKRSKVRENFNELTLRFKDNYNIIFRAYDDGIAYRFHYTGKKSFTVRNEQAEFCFPDDARATFSYVRNGGNGKVGNKFQKQFRNSFENVYTIGKLSEWDEDRLAFAPVVVEGPNGKKICITEAELLDYPGMYLYNGDATTRLTGYYASYPKKIEQGGHNELQGLVVDWEEYIAKISGPTMFPWRVVVVAETDAQLADSDLVYKLSTPPSGDFSWVKPGKVAWEWWNTWNLYGVDFETGINNDTYKYYIDFASDHGIEYVILDEGWAVNKKADLMQVVPEIDMQMLVDYATERNVGIVLWAGYWALDRDMENICRHYADMGIKGFKVDFMDRDDQPMVDFHHRAAQIGAKYGLMMDFHGTYKPTGLHRTYPNVINYEGVNGLEQMKWSADLDQVTYEVIIPFVRQVAGPMDYTQGSMRNATKGNFRAVYSEAMSQGTRCRQLAQYVIFESPLNMLCDSPSNYMNEAECTAFIAAIPSVWDETVALNGEIGKYISMARRSGNSWYVGSMTGWDTREIELNLTFLGEGDFVAEIYRDGVNAAKAARDYKKETMEIPADRRLKIKMAPGGGWAAKIVRAEDIKVNFRNDYYDNRRIEQEGREIAPGGVAFLGNSLTERGKWAEYFPGSNVVNFGIGGDTIDGMTDRLGFILESRPSVIFVMGGTNDILFHNPKSKVLAAKYSKILGNLREKSPGTRICVQSVIPVNEDKGGNSVWVTDKNPKIAEFNSLLKLLAADTGAEYVDVYNRLVNNGELNEAYTSDGVHLNEAGYEVWSSLLKPYFD